MPDLLRLAPALRPFFVPTKITVLTGLLAFAQAGLAQNAPETVRSWPPALQQLAKQHHIPTDSVSLWVQPVQGGPERVSIAAETPRPVASVMKLFTTGTALQTLGPAYTWKTDIGLGGKLETNGALPGSLYIKASGDPSLVLERVHLMLARWRAAGLHAIHGDIVVDRSKFVLPDHQPGAFDGRSLKPYNAGPDAFLLNHRAIVLRFRPDDARPDQIRVSMEPDLDGMTLVQQVKPSQATTCGDWREALTLSLSPDTSWRVGSDSKRRPWKIEIKGPYPRVCQEKDWPLLWTGDDDNDYADRLIGKAWRDMGGHLKGSITSGTWPADVPTWMTWTSPPLVNVVYEINKFSNNVMARQLFLSLGATDGPTDLERARQFVKQHVVNQTRDNTGQSSCDGDRLILDNGSGLSRTERSSTQCLGQWIRAVWNSPVMPELLASLPVVGQDGTARRLASANGRAHMKTGSLDGVAAIGGVADGESGQRYVVVGVVNGAAADNARPFLDAFLQWVVKDNK